MNNAAAMANPRLQQDLRSILQSAVDGRVFPGAVIAVIAGSDQFCVEAGRETFDAASPCVQTGALFDVASLTKVVATTTSVMQMLQAGRVALNDPAAKYLPRLDQPRKKDITLRQLLTHTAGFPGPHEFFRSCATRAALIDALYSVDLIAEPGTVRLYDDISFMLLALMVENLSGLEFDAYCARHIFQPLAMADTLFKPPRSGRQIIPTEIDPNRGGLLRGLVHDENAYVLGGVAGHAGLFSTAADLMRFARMMLTASDRAVLSSASIARVRQREWTDGEDEYGLGWDRIRRHYMGTLADPETIGHTGFTGTSMVISPSRVAAIILLSNRVHPQRSDAAAIHAVRRQVADAVLRESRKPA